VGERLRQFDLPEHDGNGQPIAGGSDFGFGESVYDLLGSEQHIDCDWRIWNHLRVVHRKLRRNGGRNWNVDSGYPGRNNHLLRPLGE